MRYLTEIQKKTEILYNNIRLLQGRQTAKEMAHQIGMSSPWTWSRRLECPMTFTIGELLRLSERYGVSIVDLIGKDLWIGVQKR